MRGLINGAATMTPIAAGLPALYADDDFAQRFTGALDEVLAPVVGSVDNLAAYLDPRLAPSDFLPWLGQWLGIPADQLGTSAADADALRTRLGTASDLGARRGTAGALADEVRQSTGGEITVADSGGTTWSAQPGAVPPGNARPGVAVRVRGWSGRSADKASVRALVARAVPAHVPVTVTFKEESA